LGPQPPSVSIVVPTRDRADLLRRAVETAVFGAAYPHLELIVVDNGSVEPETLGLLEELNARDDTKVLRIEAPFNFAALNNAAAKQANGEILVLLNNDVEGIDPHWLARLVDRCTTDGVGVVGARLLYGDGSLQHTGMVLGMGGLVGHWARGAPAQTEGPDGMLLRAREVSAVTAACMATRLDLYRALGGLNEAYAVEFNDVDYCLRVREAGQSVWIDPDCVLFHHEGSTRGLGRPSARVISEQIAFMKEWGSKLIHDPFFPNGTRRS
jgi:O-antigen biosynthesis protein